MQSLYEDAALALLRQRMWVLLVVDGDSGNKEDAAEVSALAGFFIFIFLRQRFNAALGAVW